MKLTSVEIHPSNPSDAEVVLSFRDPKSLNPYNIKSIFGLDSELIVPKFDGTDAAGIFNFYELSLRNRVIGVQAGLNPNFTDNETYSKLRDDLYKVIASSRTGEIQLQFKNDTEVVAAISGYISKFETDLFEKIQQVRLTIECSDPVLKGLVRTDVSVAGLDTDFDTIIQDYKSTAPHGVIFVLDFISDIADFNIVDQNSQSYFIVIPPGGFLAGDQLHISSEYNDKKLYIVRDSDIIHLADVVYTGSIWPIMFPGTNSFSLSNSTFLQWNAISYYPTYWGV